MLLRRLGWLADRPIATASRLVFTFGMPAVLFFAAARADYSRLAESRYLFAAIVATLVVVVLSQLWSRWRQFEARESAVFVQGAFRSNLGVIGIALCASAYGGEGLALAALPVAVLTILYNVIAVYLLQGGLRNSGDIWALVKGVLGNPLILGISAGMFVSLLGITVSPEVENVGGLLTRLVLPLALLTIGASLNVKVLHTSRRVTFDACLWRLMLGPCLTMLVATGFGVQGIELGVLFLLLASPVAVASFVMVVAAGGPGPLAANVVVMSTLVSALTMPLGLALLTLAGATPVPIPG
jgi:predicted permease